MLGVVRGKREPFCLGYKPISLWKDQTTSVQTCRRRFWARPWPHVIDARRSCRRWVGSSDHVIGAGGSGSSEDLLKLL